MKSIKNIALSAFLTLSIFCTVCYSSCSKNEAGAVTCMNKGTNGGGVCTCFLGTGGGNCETIYRNLYAHTYKGNPPLNAPHSDSNNTLVFTPDADTANFTTMHVLW